MMYYTIPQISGSPEEQLQQIKDFLFLQSETLNYNLQQQTPEKTFAAAQAALQNADNAEEQPDVRATYAAFRDLIVGTADLALSESDRFQAVLREVYLAESQLGTFSEQIETQIAATARNFESVWTYIGTVETSVQEAAADAATAKTYTQRQQNFIKTGYLENGADVFGIDIGLLSGSYSEDEQTITVSTPKKIRITPDKLSFYDGSAEVAYLSNGAIYFPNAVITGGSIQIGQKFSVSNAGVLSATDGTFSGSITGGTIQIGQKFSVSNDGTVTASGGSFGGDITATGGSIAGWSIGTDALYRGTQQITTATAAWDAGQPYFGVNGIQVNSTFYIGANGAGRIGNLLLDGSGNLVGASQTSTFSLDGYGITIEGAGGPSNPVFNVDENGYLTCYGAEVHGDIYANNGTFNGTITATGGNIAGWVIDSTNNKIYKSGSGQTIELIAGDSPRIKMTGAISFSGQSADALRSQIESTAAFTSETTISGETLKAMLNPVALQIKQGSSMKAEVYAFGFGAVHGSNSMILSSNGLMFNNTTRIDNSGNLFINQISSVTNTKESAQALMDNHSAQYFRFGGYGVEFGSKTINVSANGTSSATLSYNFTYTSAPTVLCGVTTTVPKNYTAEASPSTRSATIYVSSNYNQTQNMTVWYLVVGNVDA